MFDNLGAALGDAWRMVAVFVPQAYERSGEDAARPASTTTVQAEATDPIGTRMGPGGEPAGDVRN